MNTVFDDLADLVLIEILSYLSCTDALCSFTCLNDRCTQLLVEQGFFRQVNLSTAYTQQFRQLLKILPLNKIETLVIDRTGSPLQLSRWPYLPRLTRLHLRGVREYDSVLCFALLHAATLTHITIESDAHSVTNGKSAKCFHSIHSLRPLVQNILLRYLPALRSLNLGFDSSHFIKDWNTIPVRAPLTYLRVTVHRIYDLLTIMATRPLSTTLRQLHVKLRDNGRDYCTRASEMKIVFTMPSLHTFTFVKCLHHQFNDEWTLLDALTSSGIMPMLQRAKLIVAIDVSDLNRLDRSALFTDHRRIDVQYALILNDNQSHLDLDKRVPRGSRSHPRSVANVTFVSGTSNDHRPHLKPADFDVSNSSDGCFSSAPTEWPRLRLSQIHHVADRSHLWYTLPWAFNELVQLPIPDKKISQLEVLPVLRSSTTVSSSRLVRLDLLYNQMSPILTQSPIMSGENIEELHLFCCHRDIGLRLPSLRHLNVSSGLDALHRCSSISMNIQSIIIVLQRWQLPYATGDWTALRSLRSLPRLRSLRVVLYDLYMSADDPSCQIIAETAMCFVDFAFAFRRRRRFCDLDDESAFKRCCSFIDQLRRTILALSLDQKHECLVEKDGCGLIVWREQRYQHPTKTV